MTAAVMTIALGIVLRLLVPFALLILLNRSLNWIAALINGGNKY